MAKESLSHITMKDPGYDSIIINEIKEDFTLAKKKPEKKPDVLYGTCGVERENATFELDLRSGVLTISGIGITYCDVVYNPNYDLEDDFNLEKDDIEYHSPWGDEHDRYIVEVIIEEGITEIGTALFSGCDHLKTVNLSKSVISLGYGAFVGCRQLETVNGLKKDMVNQHAFEGCPALNERTKANMPPNTLRVFKL